jgi:hypothetical protein
MSELSKKIIEETLNKNPVAIKELFSEAVTSNVQDLIETIKPEFGNAIMEQQEEDPDISDEDIEEFFADFHAEYGELPMEEQLEILEEIEAELDSEELDEDEEVDEGLGAFRKRVLKDPSVKSTRVMDVKASRDEPSMDTSPKSTGEIKRGIKDANKKGRGLGFVTKEAEELDEAKINQHRQTAYDWHGGQSSALYSFASTGGKVHNKDHRDDLHHEIDKNIEWSKKDAAKEEPGQDSGKQIKRLRALKSYVAAAPIAIGEEAEELDEGSRYCKKCNMAFENKGSGCPHCK